MITQLGDFFETVRVALDGLLANRLRSALTMLGVIIGVAAVIALMSITAGAQEQVTSQISSMGTNLIVVTPASRGSVEGRGANTGGQLTNDDFAALAAPGALSAAAAVVPQYSVNGQIIFGGTNFGVSAVGTTPAYQELQSLTVAGGEFLTQQDVDRGAKVAVLGHGIAQDLFGDFDPVGQRIRLATATGRTTLTVVGVLAEQGGSMFNSVDSSVLVPLSTAQTKLASARNALGDLTLLRIDVMAVSDDQVDAVVDQVDAVLREAHGLGALDDADFSIISQATMLSAATTVTDTFTVLLGAIAGISLVVGGIGIMNIMLVSVTERTREIGLRKAIGARRSDILLQFLMEAVMLSVLGGTIGILVGWGLGKLVNLTGMLQSVVTAQSILLAVGFSAAIGLFFGIYPANQAARLSPIEALRYE